MSKIIVRYGQNMTQEIYDTIKEFDDKHASLHRTKVLELITRFNGSGWGDCEQIAKCMVCGEQIILDNSDLI